MTSTPPQLAAQVAVDAAVAGLYTYLVPEAMAPDIQVGQAVRAPLGRRSVVGYVMALKEFSGRPDERYKPIGEIIRPEPLFGPSLARLISFAAHYYFHPPGLCAKEILPGGLSPATEKFITLAEAGGRGGAMLGTEAELLDRLRPAGPGGLALRELEKEGFGPTIKKLLAEGRLSAEYGLSSRGTRPMHEWWLGPAAEPPAEPPRLGPKERELWDMVRGGPAKPLSYYATYLKDPLPKARGLAAKGLAELSQREIFRDDPGRAIWREYPPAPEPTAQQANALQKIYAALDKGRHQGFLLFGVTGSGKTEVYLRAAEHTLAQGREVMWLAPEIGLTMGLEGLLKSRLGADRVAVLHSGLSAGQRHDQWMRARRGLAPVVLGARSAVFAPLENLGLVVVDEEHDWAYKQDDGLRYNGRDLARWRAAEAGAALILGSATPSFESYQSAISGKLTLLTMKERPGTAVLPAVEIIDQGAEPARFRKPLSPPLAKRLGDTLGRGEQALLFINRRGMANLPMCLKCGEALKCPHCSRTLTLHGQDESGGFGETHAAIKESQVLICHSCGYRAIPPEACPACLSPLFRYFGVGTEKLLKLASEKFPEARAGRLDTDSVRRKGGLKKILGSFAAGEIDILVGTQMAAKGHDFPNLTLVGVVDADLGLNLPDFRAAERTFQLLSQVAGRAGRAESPGAVLIQTLNPRHPVLLTVAEHDYEAFFESEIEARSELGFPPFSRLALIRYSGPEETSLAEQAQKTRDLATPILAKLEPGLELMGPVPSPLARAKDLFRYQLLIRAASNELRHRFLSLWLPVARAALPPALRLTVDVDPYHLL
ncbi:primosomal protein N' [Deltaproteobacteria bacterium OttesenSCG-928-M10]|nr:primosomal protein N' [Deltaproteobacteria bacterium OttesenSCG-928-M10]